MSKAALLFALTGVQTIVLAFIVLTLRPLHESGGAGLTVDRIEHLKGGELTVTLWRGVKAAASQRRAA